MRLTEKLHLLYKITLSRLGEVTVLPNAQKPTQRVNENEGIEEYVPILKKQDKTPETDPNEMEISDLPN